MQAQVFEGYWENERFYPLEKPVCKVGRQRAFLTLIDEPIQNLAPIDIPIGEMPEGFTALIDKVGQEEAQRRADWLKSLAEARELAKDEPLPVFPKRSILDSPIKEVHTANDVDDISKRQAEAMRSFIEENDNCSEPVPEFERVKFREEEI